MTLERMLARLDQAAIAAGLAAAIAGSPPDAAPAWVIVRWVVLALFAADYARRLAAPGDRRARRVWLRSPLGIIDLLAWLPMVLAMAAGLRPALTDLFGALWVLKLARYSPGLAVLGLVLRNEREQLLSVLAGFAMVLVLAGTLMHLIEGAGQPKTFGTLPEALWWTVVTLTTTGYGDEIPATALGRMLAGGVMICGIGVLALWAGILANGFSQELRRRDFLRSWDLVAKVPLFRDVGAATIAEVARLLRPVEASAGTTVVRRGQYGDCMYFIVSGGLSVRVAPKPLLLGPGDFFGEIALITGGPRTATVTASEKSMLLKLDIADFHELAGHHPDLAQAIQEAAHARQPGGGEAPKRQKKREPEEGLPSHS